MRVVDDRLHLNHMTPQARGREEGKSVRRCWSITPAGLVLDGEEEAMPHRLGNEVRPADSLLSGDHRMSKRTSG